MTVREVFDSLTRYQITLVTVKFSGGNDSGGVEEVILRFADGSEIETDENASSLTPEQQQLVEACCAPVYGKYNSFDGDFSVEASIIWNVPDRQIETDGTESITEFVPIDACTLSEDDDTRNGW